MLQVTCKVLLVTVREFFTGSAGKVLKIWLWKRNFFGESLATTVRFTESKKQNDQVQVYEGSSISRILSGGFEWFIARFVM
jgi:hypothetical protein